MHDPSARLSHKPPPLHPLHTHTPTTPVAHHTPPAFPHPHRYPAALRPRSSSFVRVVRHSSFMSNMIVNVGSPRLPLAPSILGCSGFCRRPGRVHAHACAGSATVVHLSSVRGLGPLASCYPCMLHTRGQPLAALRRCQCAPPHHHTTTPPASNVLVLHRPAATRPSTTSRRRRACQVTTLLLRSLLRPLRLRLRLGAASAVMLGSASVGWTADEFEVLSAER